MYLKFDLHTGVSLAPFGFIETSRLISKLFFPLYCKYGSCGFIGFGLSTLNGSRASKVTIQGEILDAKFFAKNGPNGTYSHF